MAAKILIVDDESDIRSLVQGILEDEGYGTAPAGNGREAFARLQDERFDLVILDIWLQDSEYDGLAILEQIKADRPDLPVLMMSGHGTIETAVKAIKQGAYDFIEKPFKTDRLLLMIERALENARLRRENAALRQQTESKIELIGEAPSMQALVQMLDKVAATGSRVLIDGASGSGKEVAARYIHKQSSRAGKPFMALNCAALSPERIEQELFGAESQSGCQIGVLEQADGGTLLLDEVSDMPYETQGKILRALQDQSFSRVGGQNRIKVDVRILASTSRDLKEQIALGKMREDLYYRLNVVPIHVPTLRERISDIPLLVSYFMDMVSAQNGLPRRMISDGAMAAMQTYSWPGNVRQLKNLVEWIMILGPAGGQDHPIQMDDLPPEISQVVPAALKSGWGDEMMTLPLREAREVFEREYLIAQVGRFGGNISRTAQFVGMERSALHRKLKSLGVTTSERDEILDAADKEGGGVVTRIRA
jgi:two-component system nitrogen regulation response regulator NtrX